MKKSRKQFILESQGITLIALIVTIVILLILAGIALSLTVGNDGILNRATTAIDKTNIERAKEQVELLLAQYIIAYYEDKPVNIGTLKEYIKAQIETGKIVGSYYVTIDDSSNLTIYKGSSADETNFIIRGTLEETGKVIWKDEMDEFNCIVSYKSNAGSGKIDSVSVKSGSVVTLSSNVNGFVNDGYVFIGWIDDDGNEYSPGQEIEVTNDLVLTAKWEQVKFSVIFNGNGATGGNMEDQILEKGVNTALSENKFEKEGYEFIGWSEVQDATDIMYENCQEISIVENKTLYALWKEVKYSNINVGWMFTPAPEGGGTYSGSETSKKSDYIFLKTMGNTNKSGRVFVSTSEMIDFTKYSKIYCNMRFVSSGGVSYAWVSVVKSNTIPYYTSGNTIKSTSISKTGAYDNEITLELDVSDINENGYIQINPQCNYGNCSATIYLYNVNVE